MKQIIKKYPIWSFLIINYLVSWVFLYPCYQIILKNEKITPIALIGLIGAYGPSIAAIAVQYIIDKKRLIPLFKRLIKFKTGLSIWIFVMVGPVLLYIFSYLISVEIYDGSNEINWVRGLQAYPFYVLAALPFGPMGEELGWRGFMLPHLLRKYSILKSTVLVGLAWGIWHLASFSFPGAAIPDFLPVNIWTVGLFCLNTISLSMVYTYLHFKSKGSILMAIMLHAFFNAAANITFSFFGEDDSFNILFSSYVINFLLAAVIGILLLKNDHAKI